jgi:hypothetical protein
MLVSRHITSQEGEEYRYGGQAKKTCTGSFGSYLVMVTK